MLCLSGSNKYFVQLICSILFQKALQQFQRKKWQILPIILYAENDIKKDPIFKQREEFQVQGFRNYAQIPNRILNLTLSA